MFNLCWFQISPPASWGFRQALRWLPTISAGLCRVFAKQSMPSGNEVGVSNSKVHFWAPQAKIATKWLGDYVISLPHTINCLTRTIKDCFHAIAVGAILQHGEPPT